MSHPLSISVVCTPGFEPVTREEIRRLGFDVDVAAPGERAEPGLIRLAGDHDAVYRLNLHLRTAARVRIDTEPFLAAAFSELRKKAARLPWSDYLAPGSPVTVKVTTHGSALYHKKGIAERVAGAISDALGRASALQVAADEDAGTAPIVFVRLVRNLCTVSIDSSGDHLHRRGYRQAVAKAPLRENLAAALVLASGWPGDVPLIDPFCGSGTLVIEAAMIAAGIPPGAGRTFAFTRWPSFQSARWQRILGDAAPARRAASPVLTGFDRDAGAIAAATANADRAGVGGLVAFERRSISALTVPDGPGWIVTNPPYGERVKGGPDLRNLYARLGSVWRATGPLWHSYLVTSSPRWTGQLGCPVTPVASFLNGGLPVVFFRMERGMTGA